MKSYLLPTLVIPLSILLLNSCDYKRAATYVVEPSVDAEHRGQVDDVALHLYDSENRFVGYQDGLIPMSFNVNSYQSYGRLGFVSWGNSKDPGQSSNAVEMMTHFDSHRLMLDDSTATYAGFQLKRSPANLFHAITSGRFLDEYTDPTIGYNRYLLGDLKMRRVVSSYDITVLHIEKFHPSTTHDYKLLVKQPYSGFDFSAKLVGPPSYFMPQGIYSADCDRFRTAVNYGLPTDNKYIEISLYDGTRFLYSTIIDINADKLKLQPDKLHHIVIDFNNPAGVWIDTAEWDDEIIEQPF